MEFKGFVPDNSTILFQITQNIIDKFIFQREGEVKRATLNKDIRNLKTFVNWCRENRYLNGNIKIKELKEEKRCKVVTIQRTSTPLTEPDVQMSG